MQAPYQAVLLIAFGGPTSREEIRPFLARVLKGIPVPAERVEEVVDHYEAVGGRSPLNDITSRQARALQKTLTDNGFPLRVYVGMRNSNPFFVDTLKQMSHEGVKTALGFILSAQQNEAGWQRYQKDVAEARTAAGDSAPAIDYCKGWHAHPLFIRTWAEQIRPHFGELGSHSQETPLIFTAHSLPVPMAARSPYVEQLQTGARLIAEELSHRHWSIAYQSRSGKPSDPWLEPDIIQVIHDLAARGTPQVVVAPIGFVCDHVEVLYDLDIDARNVAEKLGVRLLRASCPNDHPLFIQMMAEIIKNKIQGC
jgi:ferrochelatase